MNRGTTLAIFASGGGSNARRIIEHFRSSSDIKVGLIVCNNHKAGVLNVAAEEGIPTLLLSRDHFSQTGYLSELESHGVGFIALAGFLWRLPSILTQHYAHRIANIHPALLPAHGGKGMYGRHVHEAVINSAAPQSGITIHLVDEEYDHGKVIFQASYPVGKADTAPLLEERIRQLEHQHYPLILELLIKALS